MDGIVAMGGNVAVGVTLGGSVLVRVSLSGSVDVGVSLGVSGVVGGYVAVSVALGVNVAVRMCGKVVVGRIVGISSKVAVGGVVGISGEVLVGGIVGICDQVVVGGNVAEGGIVIVELGCGSTVVVNVVDVVYPFHFCQGLGGSVVVRITEVCSSLSRGKSCVGEDLEGVLIFKILFRTSTMDLGNFSFPFSYR